MTIPEQYAFPRYLAAKKSVDDRALNRWVWQALLQALPAADGQPLRVLEVGAGTGSMVERMLGWGALGAAEYTAIDAAAENIAAAQDELPAWAAAAGYRVEQVGGAGGQP
ncbi:MAG: hypothetical protein ACKOC5_12690, partial [Chloroflexota bacterium]